MVHPTLTEKIHKHRIATSSRLTLLFGRKQ
jgi:hypothetical protein